MTPPSAQVGVDSTLQLTATPRDPNGGVLDGRAVTWSSSAPGRASVSQTGLVRGLSPGQATISASVEGITGSAAVAVMAGPATQLSFTVQPTSATAGAALSPALKVAARDAHGNTATGFTGPVSIALASGPTGATLGGNTTMNAVAGTATFPGVFIEKSGTGYTLSATAAGLQTITSTQFAITAAPAARTSFTVQPSAVVAGAAITPAVKAAIQDPFGNLVTSFSGNVTVAIAMNPAGGTLSGTLTNPVVGGIATFPDLNLDKVGTGYTLQAISGTLIAETSSAFDVTVGTATRLALTTPPSGSAQSGVALAQQPVVQVVDGSGNPVGQGGTLVTASVASGPGGATLTNATATTAADGTATFSGLAITGSVGSYTLSFGSTGLASATSGTIALSAGTPVTLAFGQQPTSTTGGAAISPAVTVQILDSAGNLTSSGASVTLAITPGTGTGGAHLSGGASVTTGAVNGVATFNSLSIDSAGTGYTLTATSGGLTSAVSSSFDITAGTAAKLAFGQQPTSGTAGATISPAVTVRILDAIGNQTASGASVTLAITSGTGTGGAHLSGGASVTIGAVSGVATFNSLSIDSAGTGYTLTATSGGLTSAISSSFDITAGTGARLAFGQQPTSGTAGATIAPAVTVRILDADGNLTTSSASVTVAITSGTGTGGAHLSGGAGVTIGAVNGVATFNSLSIDSAGTGYTLTATAGGLASDISNSFDITVGTAATVVFGQQPTSITAGATIAPAVTVRILDADGNQTSSGASVTVAITPGTGTGGAHLSGGASVTTSAVNGVATFNSLSIDSAGTGYTLTATSGGLTNDISSSFDITAGTAATVVFGQQPTSSTAGATISPAVTVRILDAIGNLTSSTAGVTLAVTSGTGTGGAHLSGGASVTVGAVSGVATFNSLSIDSAGTGYTLTATSGGLTSAISTSFNITAGTAAMLAFGQQPTATTGGATISPAVTVRILDSDGNQTSSNASVTVAITAGTGTGGAQLSGGASVTTSAVNGVATFNALSIDSAGTSYTLTATSGSLTSAVSNPFDITVGTAAKLAFGQQPTATTAGATISPAVTVQILDAGGNQTSSGASVTVAITSATGTGGAHLSGGTSVATGAVNGVATFNSLSIDSAGTGYTLTATSGSLTSAVSSPFNITAGTAAKLAFGQQPTSTTGGATLSPAVTVRILDVIGNLTSSTAGVTVAITPGTGTSGAHLSGGASVMVAAVNGVATFSTLSVDSAGTAYTLSASSTGVTGAISTSFDIAVGQADAGKSTVVVSTDTIGQCLNPCELLKNGATLVTVTARDAGGNTVPGTAVTLNASPASTDSNRFTSPGPTGTTDGSGVFTANFNSAQALLDKAIGATAGGTAITQTATVHVMPVLVGAGDIADCTTDRDDATARLLDSIPGTVFANGDDAYPNGTLANFNLCYDPTWGRHKARTIPALGNHEYDSTATADGYFTYYGALARDASGIGIGYYSLDISTWHIVVLNSEPAGTASDQLTWLQNDLAATNKKCILALWHEPLFTSGPSVGATQTRRLWNALQNVGADLVINGHDHLYERFALQDSLGNADPTGMRELIVGTGGGETHAQFNSVLAPNDETNDSADFSRGVLRLTLYADSYRWEFIPAQFAGAGTYTDSGTQACH